MILSKLRQLRSRAAALNRARDLARARELWQTRRYAEANRAIDRVLHVDPNDSQGQWLRRMLIIAPEADHAQQLWNQVRRDEAKDILLRLAERHPEEPEVHLRLAPMLVVEGHYQEAAQHAHRAADLAPNDPNVLYRAAAQARWGDREIARDFLERTKALIATGAHPDFAFSADIPHLEGLLTFAEGRSDAALAELEKAFERQPASKFIAGDLAEAHVCHGHYERAIEVIAQGLEHHPGDDRLLGIYAQIARTDS